MPTILLRFTIVMLALSFAALADAQVGDWYVAPSIVFTNDDGARVLDDSLSGGQISIGRDLTKYLSVEGLLGYSSTFRLLCAWQVAGLIKTTSISVPTCSLTTIAIACLRRTCCSALAISGWMLMRARNFRAIPGRTTTQLPRSASASNGGWAKAIIRFGPSIAWRTAFDDAESNRSADVARRAIRLRWIQRRLWCSRVKHRHRWRAPLVCRAIMVFTNDDGARVLDDSLSGGQISIGRDLTKHLSVEGLLGYSSLSAYCVPGRLLG